MCQNNLTQARVWLQNEIHATTSPSDESQYISHACTKYSIVSVLLPCTELTSPVHTTSQYRRFFTGRPAEFWECCCWDSATRDFLMCEVNPNLKWKPVVLTRLNHSKFSLSQISWSHSTCHPPNSFNVQESQSEGAAGWENIGFSCGRTSSWFRRVRHHRLPSSRIRSSQLADTHPPCWWRTICMWTKLQHWQTTWRGSWKTDSDRKGYCLPVDGRHWKKGIPLYGLGGEPWE